METKNILMKKDEQDVFFVIDLNGKVNSDSKSKYYLKLENEINNLKEYNKIVDYFKLLMYFVEFVILKKID